MTPVQARGSRRTRMKTCRTEFSVLAEMAKKMTKGEKHMDQDDRPPNGAPPPGSKPGPASVKAVCLGCQ